MTNKVHEVTLKGPEYAVLSFRLKNNTSSMCVGSCQQTGKDRAKNPWEVAVKYSRGRSDEGLPGEEIEQKSARKRSQMKGVDAGTECSVNTLVQHTEIYLYNFGNALKESKTW